MSKLPSFPFRDAMKPIKRDLCTRVPSHTIDAIEAEVKRREADNENNATFTGVVSDWLEIGRQAQARAIARHKLG